MSKFQLLNQTLTFSDASDRYYGMIKKFRLAKRRAAKDFYEFYKKCDNISTVLDDYPEFLGEVTQVHIMDELFATLPDFEIYDVTRNKFEDQCWNLEAAQKSYDAIAEKYNEIIEDLEDAKQYRQMRKDCRGRFIGGGFGVKGAMKGVATAGALNLVTGIGHSIFNSIGNMSSSAAASNEKKRLYNSEKTMDTLCQGIFDSIAASLDDYMNFVNKYCIDDDRSRQFDGRCFDLEKAEALFENAKAIPDKRELLLFKSIEHCPYDADTLSYIFENYEDERKNVCTIADFFSVDISDCYEGLFEEIYTDEVQEDMEETFKARAQVKALMEQYGVLYSETMDSIDADCLIWISEEEYDTKLPGQRDAALKRIREFDTSEELKKEFIQEANIWELAQEYQVSFDMKSSAAIIYDTYKELVNANATYEEVAAILDAVFKALAFANEEGAMANDVKEAFFSFLSDVSNIKLKMEQDVAKEKQALLAPVQEFIENSIRNDGVAFGTTSLTYKKGEAEKHINKVTYTTLEEGEVPLVIYDMHPIGDPNKYGFVFTDKRIIARQERGVFFEIFHSEKPIFSESGLVSTKLELFCKSKLHSIDVSNLSSIKKLRACLESASKQLLALAEKIEAVQSDASIMYNAEAMNCIKNNPYLVDYFGMQEAANKILEAGRASEGLAEQKKQKAEIVAIFEACKKDADSIADTWIRLVTSQYDPKLYEKELDGLYGYFVSIINAARFYEILDKADKARLRIADVASDLKLRRLGEIIETRRKELRKSKIQAIIKNCDMTDPDRIVVAWKQYLSSDYAPEEYANELTTLFQALKMLITSSQSISKLQNAVKARDLLLAVSDEEKLRLLSTEIEKKEAELRKKDIHDILDDCSKSNPASIAEHWLQYIDRGYTRDECSAQLDTLYAYLAAAVEAASTSSKITAAENARLQILEKDNDERLQALAPVIAEKTAKIKEQEALQGQRNHISRIYDSHDANNLTSIVETRKELEKTGYSPDLLQEAIAGLDEAISRMIKNKRSIPALQDMQTTLLAQPAQRYQQHLDAISAKITKLEIESRTYRNIVFDSQEDIAFAQEEEKRMDVIMRSVSKDNVASIEEAIAQIDASISKIKAVYLDTLNGYLTEYDTNQKTYKGITYNTVEEAENARMIYASARQTMQMLDQSNEASVQQAYDAFVAHNSPHLQEFIATLTAILHDFDVKKRTIDGILYDTLEEAKIAEEELRNIRGIMATLDINNEPAMVTAKDQIAAMSTSVKNKYVASIETSLTDYDIRMRTFKGKLYDNRQIVVTLKEEDAAINNIMATVTTTDEPAMLQAKAQLETLTTFLKDEPIAYLTQKLKEYDINARTFQGVLYDTREEAALIAQEYRQAMDIMSKVSADDEQSILTAQTEILKLTTSIKDKQYAVLKAMWEDYDLRQRTYMSIVFDTREQAQIAQQTRTEFLNIFNTYDLQQASTIAVLENYVEDTLHEKIKPEAKQMINAVKQVHEKIAYVVAEDGRINPAAQKKESSALYKQAEALVPLMTQYRMNTQQIEAIKSRHYGSLNVAQKFLRFFK